ncbi:MAG TPA: hypothetical protein VIP98_13395 [Microlunatus sp.]
MTRLVVHIGLPKSGSSAVQAFAADNGDRLREHGFGWLPGRRGPNLTELAVAFCDRDNPISRRYGVDHDHDRRKLQLRLRRRLTEAVDQHRQLIISSEHLSALLRSAAEVAELADYLHSISDQVLIIGVVRRGDHWLPSDWVEAVRSGRTIRLGRRFVERRAHLLDHQSLVSRWTTAFGADGVRLIPYLEDDKSDPVALPERLLAAAGVPRSADDWRRPAQLTRSGLSATAVEVLRQLNPQLGLADWHSGADRQRLITLLDQRHPGPGPGLTRPALAGLEEHGWIRTGIEQTEASFGDHWSDWVQAPMASIQAAAEPEPAVVQDTLAALRAAGFGSRNPIRTRAERLLQRVRR